MASNGLVFRPGRGPSFILVGLVVIVIILFYSYWGVSSKNNKLLRDVSVLQDRLRVLAARKLTSDKKTSALSTQLTQLQEEKEKIGGLLKAKDADLGEVRNQVEQKENELVKLHQQQVRFTYNCIHAYKIVPSSFVAFKMPAYILIAFSFCLHVKPVFKLYPCCSTVSVFQCGKYVFEFESLINSRKMFRIFPAISAYYNFDNSSSLC